MILDQFRLDGKVAIVTGCNRGLGRSMALGLAEAGADIVGVFSSSEGDVAYEVSARGRRFVGVQADLRERGVHLDIVDRAEKSFGGVDILINNAGIIKRCSALDFSEQDWDEVMNVNLNALFFLSQAVARLMVEQQRRGKIINIASMLSFQGGILVSPYTASKSGVMGLTRILAAEWAPLGINVNAIAPGYMATDNTAPIRADENRNRQILERIPAGRWGEPDDLQGCAVFLASSASDYVHGYTFAVDGGWLAR
ncbi:2-dehydro-3-deoxy-D-gluconate 5-dehydrogenase KduD [Desulfofustis glycolicus]|uniref:2-dehydro-3-deoxy-D-gluconate 5-dehydrogenase n=1 Tax=Desulfofustis glycolicus DSM 9705 TaxID=1121409 RepID=A0A1M5YEE6_9BACT|nr:2-dehydro-3-deoxy-D-gluconate 5-dehydrogenase KduD [Desulfofustis glycolicus]MCB2216905.1 2-dehydro-3-deoxy-D-gluconate 5-dehydrogenase KduD [Desulfobulbaceae bacterium]SHI10322.1 2-deoxy-D-gluconate 3-dehydrogenase [Desulfofustis glycolicus DSM 9705]